jgi:penicillin-binding protein 1A
MHWNGTGVTGGSLPAMAWHSFMSVAHKDMNIPPIPGLPLHPNQVAEQQRLAELKRNEPAAAQARGSTAQGVPQKRASIMPDRTRELLKKLAETMRRANGDQATPASAPAEPGNMPPKPRAPADKGRPASQPDRRAQAPVSLQPPRP